MILEAFNPPNFLFTTEGASFAHPLFYLGYDASTPLTANIISITTKSRGSSADKAVTPAE